MARQGEVLLSAEVQANLALDFMSTALSLAAQLAVSVERDTNSITVDLAAQGDISLAAAGFSFVAFANLQGQAVATLRPLQFQTFYLMAWVRDGEREREWVEPEWRKRERRGREGGER